MESLFFYVLVASGSIIGDLKIHQWTMLAHPQPAALASRVYYTEEACEETKSNLHQLPNWNSVLNNPDFEITLECVKLPGVPPSDALKQRLQDQIKKKSF